MISTDDILYSFWKTLSDDVTLSGASYLGGSGRVYKSHIRPDNAALPCITLRVLPIDDIGQQSFASHFEVWVNINAKNNANRMPDTKRVSDIEQRCYELLHDQNLKLKSGKNQILCRRRRPGFFIGIDPQASDQSVHQTIYEVILADA